MKIRFRRDGFPVQIPWPGEGEWTTGQLHEYGTNKCCMVGWMRVAWGGSTAPIGKSAPAAAVSRKAMQLAAARGFKSRKGNNNVVRFNDDDETTDAMRSAFWAELWGSFGYEECP